MFRKDTVDALLFNSVQELICYDIFMCWIQGLS